jgi:hypothetical protein
VVPPDTPFGNHWSRETEKNRGNHRIEQPRFESRTSPVWSDSADHSSAKFDAQKERWLPVSKQNNWRQCCKKGISYVFTRDRCFRRSVLHVLLICLHCTYTHTLLRNNILKDLYTSVQEIKSNCVTESPLCSRIKSKSVFPFSASYARWHLLTATATCFIYDTSLDAVQEHAACTNILYCVLHASVADNETGWSGCVTRRDQRVVSASASYLGRAVFKYRPGDRLSWLRFFVVILRPFGQIPW